MKLLLDNFNLVAHAPGGIARPRKIILELAVRGKLVEQDRTDEPATVLLEKIRKEKARLVAEGKIRAGKELAPIGDGEKPYELAEGWEWVRSGEICENIQYGFTASADHQAKEVRLLRITDIQNNTVNWDSVPGCRIDPDNVAQYSLRRGDVL